MNLVYAFIGTLPSYSIDTVHQARLFYDGPIYFIVSDYESSLVDILKAKYGVTIIRYDSVIDEDFNKLLARNFHRFEIVPNLKGREKLFIYSFERFYLLNNLMKQQNLQHVLFAELDNLLYNDPREWLDGFLTHDMSYMFDNVNRGASGIAFLRSTSLLAEFLKCCSEFIESTKEFLNEMTVLYNFWTNHQTTVQLLPIYWTDPAHPPQANATFPIFNSVFDAASMGICLGGMDPHHTQGVIIKGLAGKWSYHDFSKYTYNWKKDEKDRLIPYILSTKDNTWIRINNLHIHSKDLTPYLSSPIKTNDSAYTHYMNIAVICNTELETNRLTTLKKITDHYGVVPGYTVYGEDAKKHPYYPKFNCKINAISLAINHITLLEQYKDSNKPLLIFESDVLCLSDFTVLDARLNQIIQDMNTHGIDFVFLGKGPFPNVDKNNYKHVVHDLYKAERSRCTEAYLISPRGIKAYLEYFYSTDNHTTIDDDYTVLFKARPEILPCWALPELFYQGSLTGVYASLVPLSCV